MARGSIPAVAQDATPAASPVVDSAPPTACTVAPQSIDEIRSLWTGSAGNPVADQEPSPVTTATLPQGEPAAPATVAAVAAVARMYVACGNAGAKLRTFALSSDDVIRRIAPPAGQPTADLLVGLAATPAPWEVLARNAIGDAREARVLADGRVGALFSIGEPGAGAFSTVWFVFEQRDGRCLIDDIADLGLEHTSAG